MKDKVSTIEEEENAKTILTMKKIMLKYRSIGLSTRSGKTEIKKKKAEGIKAAAQKTNFSLKAANTGSAA